MSNLANDAIQNKFCFFQWLGAGLERVATQEVFECTFGGPIGTSPQVAKFLQLMFSF